MEPVFRVLTRWSRSTDAAFYDTFQRPNREHWWPEGILALLASGYLYMRIFVWGIFPLEGWGVFLTLSSVVLLTYALRFIYVVRHKREWYLKEKDAERQERVGAREDLRAVLFYEEFLVQYDMLSGEAIRVDYDQIKRFQVARGYIFLEIKKSDVKICLEKEGFAGQSPINALKWLTVRCRLKM